MSAFVIRLSYCGHQFCLKHWCKMDEQIWSRLDRSYWCRTKFTLEIASNFLGYIKKKRNTRDLEFPATLYKSTMNISIRDNRSVSKWYVLEWYPLYRENVTWSYLLIDCYTEDYLCSWESAVLDSSHLSVRLEVEKSVSQLYFSVDRYKLARYTSTVIKL